VLNVGKSHKPNSSVAIRDFTHALRPSTHAALTLCCAVNSLPLPCDVQYYILPLNSDCITASHYSNTALYCITASHYSNTALYFITASHYSNTALYCITASHYSNTALYCITASHYSNTALYCITASHYSNTALYCITASQYSNTALYSQSLTIILGFLSLTLMSVPPHKFMCPPFCYY